MTILNAEILPKSGPNIEFAALPACLEIDDHDWPDASLYQEHIFYAWPDDLCGAMCVLARQYLFFDEYNFTQYHTREQIYRFVSEIFNMASRIAACPVHYFDSELYLYEKSEGKAQRSHGCEP